DFNGPNAYSQILLVNDISAQRTFDHCAHILYAGVQIDHGWVQMLSPRKRQQLTSQSFSPLGSGLYCFDGARQFWIEQAFEQLRATANDHQQVIEVVRNAAC